MSELNRKIRLRKKLPLKSKQLTTLKNLAIAFVLVALGAFLYLKYLAPHTQEAKQRVKLESTSKQLQETIKKLEAQKVKDAEQQKKLDETNKQLEQTKKELEAKRNAATVYAADLSYAPAVIPNCGDNSYAQYIYQHESGCNLNSVNSLGCRGIGQACPGDKLPCGADYACQNAFFTSYAIGRYGSWEAAYNFWRANSWW